MKYLKKYLVWEIGIFMMLSIFLWNKSSIYMYSMISDSMEPKIKVGSLIISKKEEFNKLEIGDIITYKMTNSDIYVTHEIIEVDKINKRVLTKGIANKDSDNDYIQEYQYKSTSILIIPYMGYLGILYHYSIIKISIWLALVMYIVIQIRKRTTIM